MSNPDNEILVVNNLKSKNQDELFDKIFEILYEKGYVTKNYKEAVKIRENEYPTGFELDGYGIAIPHTDAEYSKKNCLLVCKLKDEVIFKDAETLNPLKVKLIFALTFENNSKDMHIDTLAKLMALINSKEKTNKIINSDSCKEIQQELINFFNTGGKA